MRSDLGHPFYKPLWRRIVLVAVVAGWAFFETVIARDATWTVISAGLLAYAVWTFLIRWPKDDEPGKTDAPPR